MKNNNLTYMIGIFFLIIVLALNVNMVSAWPFQLNLTSGTLYDMNASNNATTNFTIYVVNQTYILNNYTNVTIYMNMTNTTCYNCTQNYNYTYNYLFGGNVTQIYNATQADARFLSIIDFNNYKTALTYPYPSRIEFDNLTAFVSGIDNNSTNDLTGLWIVSVLALIISIIGVIMLIYLGSGGTG